MNVNASDLGISTFPHKHVTSSYVNNKNGNQTDLPPYLCGVFQQPRNFLKLYQDHLDGNNSHLKLIHTFKNIDKNHVTQGKKMHQKENVFNKNKPHALHIVQIIMLIPILREQYNSLLTFSHLN